MAMINAVVINSQKLKSGKYRIKISVAHKGITRYISTDMDIESPSLLKNNKVVRGENSSIYNMKIKAILEKYEKILLEIDTDAYNCQQLIEILKRGKSDNAQTLRCALDSYVKSLERPKSVKLYTLAVNRFIKFMGYEVMLRDITPENIQGFSNKLVNDKLSPTSINIYTTLLKVVIDYAIKLKIADYKVYPYEVYKKPSANVRDLDISVTELKRIRDLEIDRYNLRIVRDIFMLSYYLAGMNIGDILAYNFKGKKQVTYTRIKTEHTKDGNLQTCFSIQPEAKEIIDRYMDKSGKLVFGRYETRSKVDNLLFRQMQNLATEAGISRKLIYYSARKSFVQHGFEIGIPLETLEYCIGQSMKKNRPIFNYVKIMSKHADLAIRQILDNLK